MGILPPPSALFNPHQRKQSNSVLHKHLDGWPLVNTSCWGFLVHLVALKRAVLIINIFLFTLSTEMGTRPIIYPVSLLVQNLYKMTHPTPILKTDAACKSNMSTHWKHCPHPHSAKIQNQNQHLQNFHSQQCGRFFWKYSDSPAVYSVSHIYNDLDQPAL